MNTIAHVLYTGKTRTTGGREGAARSDDGRLDIVLAPPGGHGKGTNPEQLFAAGWSACFIGAPGRAARERHVAHRICPYPKMARNDIDVEIALA